MENFLDEQEWKPRSSCIKIDPISGDVSLQRKIPKIQTILNRLGLFRFSKINVIIFVKWKHGLNRTMERYCFPEDVGGGGCIQY